MAAADGRPVLWGPKSPEWGCNRCGESGNWASRVRCKKCGAWCPYTVYERAVATDRDRTKQPAPKASVGWQPWHQQWPKLPSPSVSGKSTSSGGSGSFDEQVAKAVQEQISKQIAALNNAWRTKLGDSCPAE